MKPILMKLTALKEQQTQIRKLHAEFKMREGELVKEHDEKQTALKTTYEGMITEAGAALREAQQKYKADCRATFGIADGDPADVVGMVETIQKVIELQ